jgi:hypothetical protein
MAALTPQIARADGCALDARQGETVRVKAMLDERRIALEDGRTIRLAGLDLPLGLPATDLGALIGRDVVLVALGGTDRHGDLRGDLYVEGLSLAEAALAAGRARVRPAPGDGACWATLLGAEDRARRGGLGLWGEPRYAVLDASDPVAVARQEGKFAIVSGRIRHVGTSRDRVWIDFGDMWRTDVTLVLPEEERSRFVAAGVDPEALEGRVVRARGIVAMRDGPRIDVTEPAALERLPD